MAETGQPISETEHAASITEVEFLILANHAEAQNGLLYLVGGGWTDHWRFIRQGMPLPVSHCGIGVGVIVDWNDTNRPHRLTLRIETDDGKQVGVIQGDIVVGRPPMLQPGAPQRAALAFNLDLQWPQPGGYRIVAQLSTTPGVEKKVMFRVHDQPAPPQLIPPQPPQPAA